MAPNKYLLIPASNFRERGVCIPAICEADVADLVLRAMSETLEEFSVASERYWDNVNPGPGELAISVGVLYNQRQIATNFSEIGYGDGGEELASLLGETVSEWGRCCAFGHRVKNPKNTEQASRIKLSIFALNGPGADQYLCRLTDLGRQLAQCVADFHRGVSTAVPKVLEEHID